MRGARRFELGPREWALLLLLALIWGSSFLFIGIGLRGWPPLTLAAARIVIAALVLWLLLALRGEGRVRLPWRACVTMGLLNNVLPFVLIAWAQLHIAAGLAAILVATTPLLGLVLARRFLPDEPLSRAKVAGCVAGCIGVALIVRGEWVAGTREALAGIVACLLGAACFAAAGTFGRRFARDGVTPLASAAGQLAASSLLLLPVALVVDRPWALPLPGVEVWLATFALGLFSTALAYVIYFAILAAAGSTNLLLVNLLVPVPAIMLGALWLGQRLDAVHFGGLALIVAGLLAVDGRLWRGRAAGARRPSA